MKHLNYEENIPSKYVISKELLQEFHNFIQGNRTIKIELIIEKSI